MERFRLCLLGPFQALLAGKPITGFESNKTRALLAYLAAENGRPHSREFLAELLWPERPQGVALANLRHTLADLRTAIADHDAAQPCLLVTHQTLQFDPACPASGDVFVDVVRFGALLAGGMCTSLAVSEEAIAACANAVALYGGQFLQGFALDGSPGFEAWLVVQRERWDHLAAKALARLIRHAADQGDYAQGARWAQRRLELEPWNEDVHQQLIWLPAANAPPPCASMKPVRACLRPNSTWSRSRPPSAWPATSLPR